MKKLLLLFFCLLAAVWIGLLIQRYPGYVLVQIAGFQAQTSFWFALFLILASFAALFYAVKCVRGLFSIPTRWMNWLRERKIQKGSRRLSEGLSFLLLDDAEHASDLLTSAFSFLPQSFLACLGAAFAAQRAGDLAQRDRCIEAAHAVAHAREAFIAGLAYAQMQRQSGQYELAQDGLLRLRSKAKTYPIVWRELAALYFAQENWDALVNLLPMLDRYHTSLFQAISSSLSLSKPLACVIWLLPKRIQILQPSRQRGAEFQRS